MDELTPNYRRQFWKSPHHAWLGLLTLGAGFISAQPLLLLAGATTYLLGLIYMPDLGFFKRWVDRRLRAAAEAVAKAQLEEFLQRRAKLLQDLSPHRRERYQSLVRVCQEIEEATKDDPLASSDPSADPRLRKLDELMWTFLRLLSLEESLDRFLETEIRENLPNRLEETEQEIGQLSKEIDGLKTRGDDTALEARQRLRDSRLEFLEVLRKRLRRLDQAKANLDLVLSEEERLDQQIKLLRSDAVAVKNTGALSARIDATVEHLEETNQWLTELDQFKDAVGDLPPSDLRVGYQAVTVKVPPLITPKGSRTIYPGKQTGG